MKKMLKDLKKHVGLEELTVISSYLDDQSLEGWHACSLIVFARTTLPVNLMTGITNANLKIPNKDFGYPYTSQEIPNAFDVARGLKWISSLLEKFNKIPPPNRTGGSPVALSA